MNPVFSAASGVTETSPMVSTHSATISTLYQKLNEIKVPVVKASVEEAKEVKEQFKTTLGEAYKIIVKELPNAKTHERQKYLTLLSEVMSKFGRLRYEENYPSCMVLMRGSLNVQLSTFGVYEGGLAFELSEDLAHLEQTLFNHANFSTFDDFICNSDMDAIASKIQDKKISPAKLIKAAFTLSWLANSLHHTQGYREREDDASVKEMNHKRFDQVYALTAKLLTLANTSEANLELAELYYNGMRGIEFRKDPNNIGGAHKWLDLAMELNPSKEMAARIANRKSCDWMSVDLKKAIAFLTQAIEIRKSFPKEEQDPFLVANLNSRHADFLQKNENLEAADKAIDLALEYSTGCRGDRDPMTDKIKDPTHDHQYFGLYDIKKAQIQLALGNTQEAIKYIDRALETFEHHKQDSADLIADALKIKAECSK